MLTSALFWMSSSAILSNPKAQCTCSAWNENGCVIYTKNRFFLASEFATKFCEDILFWLTFHEHKEFAHENFFKRHFIFLKKIFAKMFTISFHAELCTDPKSEFSYCNDFTMIPAARAMFNAVLLKMLIALISAPFSSISFTLLSRPMSLNSNSFVSLFYSKMRRTLYYNWKYLKRYHVKLQKEVRHLCYNILYLCLHLFPQAFEEFPEILWITRTY